MASNLLIITFDQLREDVCTGIKGKDVMPNINKLSSRSRETKNCYTTSPACVPARLSWLTGEFSSRYRVTNNKDMNIDSNIDSVFKDISKTHDIHIIGKTHWTSHNHECDLRDNIEIMKKLGIRTIEEIGGPRALMRVRCNLTDAWEEEGYLQGYKESLFARYRTGDESDAWKVESTILPMDLYPDVWLTEKAIMKIRTRDNQKPWIIWLSFIGPHEPFDMPEEWINKNYKIKDEIKDKVKWPMELKCHLGSTCKKWENKIDEEDIKKIRRNYYLKCSFLDMLSKRVINEARKNVFRRKTNILITSDHGEMLGDYGMLYKSNFLEEAIRIPFVYSEDIRKWPKIFTIAGISRKKDKGKSNKIMSSTELMKTAINEQKGKGVFKNILSKVKENRAGAKHIVVEFGKEILILSKKRKLAINMQGKILWGSKRNSPIEANRYETDQNRKYWNKMEILAIMEVKKRKLKEWILRDL